MADYRSVGRKTGATALGVPPVMPSHRHRAWGLTRNEGVWRGMVLGRLEGSPDLRIGRFGLLRELTLPPFTGK